MPSDLDLYTLAGESIAVLRKRYIGICDNNHCAAMLLDIFYAATESAQEWNNYHEDNQQAAYITTSIDNLTSRFFGLFDVDTVRESLIYLIDKLYVRAWYIDAIKISRSGLANDDGLKIECDRKIVEKALQPYFEAAQAARDEAHRKWLREHPPAPQPTPPSPEEVARKEREAIYAREVSRVNQQVKRAIKSNLEGTLTIDEWIATLDYFGWVCAYCGGEYTLLEHFIPLNHEGGTTQTNCIPACHGCNSIKKAWHPDKIPYPNTMSAGKLKLGVARARRYFAMLEGGVTA